MRVVAVSGRTVRHPQNRRIIDARGIPYDPHCVTIHRYIADGDLTLVEDEPEASPAPEGEALIDPLSNETASASGAGEASE